MSLDLAAGLLALAALVFFGPASIRLEQASWPSRCPRAAVALWQSLGVAGSLAVIGSGLAVAVAHFHAGLVGGVSELAQGLATGRPMSSLGLADALSLTLATDVAVILVSVVAIAMVRTLCIRARHRRLLDLVGVDAEGVPGALLLDHPRATAYCLPGLRPRIVVSTGTVHLLAPAELAAVVEHERGHAQERHGLVMLPLASLTQLLRWIPYVRLAPRAVATLLEMAADDYAAREHDPRSLARALIQMGTSAVSPSCAFSASSTAVPARVHRLLEPRRTSRATAAAAVAGTVAVLVVPLLALVAS